MRSRSALIRSLVLALPVLCALEQPLAAATFGTVVPIGGQASDLALDESRRVLYIANFNGNRVDVMSLDNNAITRSIQVTAQPSAIALSRDNKYLVIGHYGNFEAARNAVTVLNLEDNSRRVFGVGSSPLAVAFTNQNLALVVTSTEFLLFDPMSGQTHTIDTVAGLQGKTLPIVAPANSQVIVRAAVAASQDGLWLFGLTDKFLFRYDVRLGQLGITSYTSSPEMGPRTVSVSTTGTYYLAGWGLFDRQGTLVAQFPNPSGKLDIGSHALDLERGLIYAQMTQADPAATSQTGTSTPVSSTTPAPAAATDSSGPILQVVAADNLAVLDRLQLRENLTGRSVLNSARDVLYSISASGVTIFQVGQLAKAPRIRSEQREVLFQSSSCTREQQTKDIVISNPSGGRVAFSLTTSDPAIIVTPDSGVTPAVVHITVNPGAFLNAKGTSAGYIDIHASGAVNLPDRIRVLVNNREPDQRGLIQNIPGKLVDILADPVRSRFLILRQDTDEVLVFDKNQRQIAALRTGNTPTQMAITADLRYLLVGNDNSNIASVFDLDTLQPSTPVRFPVGHYPRSIAVSGNAILASVRSGSGVHKIDRIDMASRTAFPLPNLGVYTNDVTLNTGLAASPDGSSLLIAMSDGRVLLYDANYDTFVAARKDFDKLSGAIAASSYDFFIVDNHVLNSSLVPVGTLNNGAGTSSGFLFVDQMGFRSNSLGASQAGMVERVNLSQLQGILPTRITESPLTSSTDGGFTRTLAVLGNREGLISLTTSGFTVLPWNYDAASAPPRIDRVVNAADLSDNIAPGSLVTIFGSQLSPAPGLAGDPLTADALVQSCLTVNGSLAPVIFSSPDKINAQIPYNAAGSTSLILRTPGGASDAFRVRVVPGAPAVFRTGTAGAESGIPTIVRAANNELVTVSNPIHRGDDLVIYATGLGRTNPEVPVGSPAPYEPLAYAVETPRITLGGVALPVAFAGLTPGLIGVYQVNVLVPRSVPTGFDIPLRIEQSTAASTVPVRVVP
ncbi:MAG TPA: hypothetical protein VMZ52_08915 [Bryobacteraceae bacterium]|nr:hypothetical protein [Bryobacteraceae bacterium]